MNSKIIIPILIYILLVIIAITAIIFIYYYNPFKEKEIPSNSYAKIQSNIDKLHMEAEKPKTQLAEYKDTSDDIKKEILPKKEKDQDISPEKKQYTDKSKKTSTKKTSKSIIQKQEKKPSSGESINVNYITKTPIKKSYSKGSSLPDQSFDSYGEYISQEEYNYRLTLIKNLIIKTVIIDKLTKGNGISQEFFKVVYIDKMIPAKVLEDIVESKEFRNLIPIKYRKDEIKLKGLSKGEKVIFNNQNIKDILILWSQGRLTPIQKAWKVKAEK